MSGIVGIRQAMFCKKGSLASPTEIIAMGLGDEASLEITEQPIKGYQDEDLPHETNFKAMFKTYQPTVTKIVNLLLVHGVAGGVDAQFVGEKAYLSSVYTGVYDFSGANFLGLDFEIALTMRSRYIQMTGEASLPNEVALMILQSSITNTPKDLNALSLGHRGKNLADYKHPFYGSAQSPAGTLLCNGEEIVDRSLIIRSEGSKLQYNRTRINYARVLLELTIDKNRSYQLIEYLTKDRKASVKLEEKNSVSAVETWEFGEGVLFRKHEMPISKDDTFIKLTYEKKIPLYDFGYDVPNNKISVSQAV